MQRFDRFYNEKLIDAIRMRPMGVVSEAAFQHKLCLAFLAFPFITWKVIVLFFPVMEGEEDFLLSILLLSLLKWVTNKRERELLFLFRNTFHFAVVLLLQNICSSNGRDNILFMVQWYENFYREFTRFDLLMMTINGLVENTDLLKLLLDF